MILCDLIDDSNILFHILVADRDSHTLTAENVRRTNQNRISQSVCNFFCFFCGKYSVSLWSWDLTLLQDSVKELSVLCCIYIFCRCSKDLNAHFHKSFCKFDSSLSAELYYCSVWLFDFYNIFHVLWSQRLKIQFVCNIKVCADCLRVVVNDDRLITFLGKSPGTVYGTKVKLNTLADTDRA